MRKVITTEIKNEVISMTNEGHTIGEICDVLGISSPSVSRIRKEAGLTNNVTSDKGGVISKMIPVTELRKPVKDQNVDEDVDPVMIADQSIVIAGTETLTTYKAGLLKDTIIIEGDLIVGEVKIDQLIKLVNELKGVHKIVTQMKGNRFGLM